MKTTPVRALVKVKIGSIRASSQAMPEGQAYMCWIKRNGRARGTDLVRSSVGVVEFNETVKISPITLYRLKDGSYQAKFRRGFSFAARRPERAAAPAPRTALTAERAATFRTALH